MHLSISQKSTFAESISFFNVHLIFLPILRALVLLIIETLNHFLLEEKHSRIYHETVWYAYSNLPNNRVGPFNLVGGRRLGLKKAL